MTPKTQFVLMVYNPIVLVRMRGLQIRGNYANKQTGAQSIATISMNLASGLAPGLGFDFHILRSYGTSVLLNSILFAQIMIVAKGAATAAVVEMATAMTATMEWWRWWQHGNGSGRAATAVAARQRRRQHGGCVSRVAEAARRQRQSGGGGGSMAAATVLAQCRGGQHGGCISRSSTAAKRRKQAVLRRHLQRDASGGRAVAALAERRRQRGSGVAMAGSAAEAPAV